MLALAAALFGGGLWLRSSTPSTEALRSEAGTEGVSVILIIVDTLRADRLGAYGYARPTSPNLDRLAETSVVFENAYAQAPNTPPSVASILTSLYPSSHHFTGNYDRLTEEAMTLPELLRARGYRTAAFVDGGFLKERFRLSQGFDVYDEGADGGGFERVLPAARDWLARNDGAPFFLLLHSYDVHTPYENTPLPYRDAFLERPYSGELTSDRLDAVRKKKLPSLTPEETAHFSDLYDGGILHADALLGAFFADLAADGMLDRVLLIVTSDHGEAFMEHGDLLHGRLFRTVTHVPLVVRFPRAQAGGRRVAAVVEAIDIAPTVLEALGVPGHRGMQGRSLLPAIFGRGLSDPMAVSELTWNRAQHGYYFDRWHMIRDTRAHNTQIFDVVADPLEQSNLRETHRDDIRDLVAMLQSRLVAAGARAYLPERSSPLEGGLDPATQESLRALGYLE